jgi:hypothetical protein
VVALGQDVKIRTRYDKEKTYQIDFDDKWLEDEDWELAVYEVDEIQEETTVVELQRLRVEITDEAIAHLTSQTTTSTGSLASIENTSSSPFCISNG